MRNPTNFEMAIPRLAANAAKIALRLPSVTGARLDARRSHGPIWSLCVSNGDLVTHSLDIENVGDQIDASGSMRRSGQP